MGNLWTLEANLILDTGSDETASSSSVLHLKAKVKDWCTSWQTNFWQVQPTPIFGRIQSSLQLIIVVTSTSNLPDMAST